ncbi:MAG: helix-turn-helix domain-containing protein [Erysipelotrichales bacterium]|nr:helix-turn-helix domain-containing protein [Erysipelotrichales bacterium]
MNLGEKIFKLRKEKRLSQEALAEKLGTTRQAISKWENNQGFPETEKLLQLSNVFEVSIDFLLKDEKSVKSMDEKGFYVSREMATGYLSNTKKICRYTGIAFMFWALAGVPFALFSSHDIWRYLGMAICIIIGIFSIVLGMFTEQEEYKILKVESLLFDYEYFKELSNIYISKKKKYVIIAILSTVLFVVSLLILGLTDKGYLVWSEYHSFVFLEFGVGLLGFVYSIGIMESYELLVKNERYSNSLLFKIKRKIREKIDRL